MNIKIGFSSNQREIVISSEEGETQVERIREGLRSGEEFIEVADSKGHTYLLNPAEIAYVEISSQSRQAVGFGGI